MLSTRTSTLGAFAIALFAAAPAHAGKVTTLYSFTGGADGKRPEAGLTYLAGALYGTTYYGGTSGDGTIFKLDPATGAETALYSFNTSNNGPGNPSALLSARGHALFGSVDNVDINYDEYSYAFFKFDVANSQLISIDAITGPSMLPLSDVPPNITLTRAGLYANDMNGTGGILKLSPKNGSIINNYQFINQNDGQLPSSPLIEKDGLLYGTTIFGGPEDYGVFFKLNPTTGAITVIHDFGPAPDGYYPIGPIAYAHGTFYGATSAGNVVYALNPSTGAETIYSTSETISSVAYKSGNLFLTGSASIDKLNLQTGTVTAQYKLDGMPAPGLVEVGGSFYGTTENGGSHGAGSVFKLTP
jgi:uncharacterized repeat protein (TIGR03803 family)